MATVSLITLQANTLASAAQVMSNFNALANAINGGLDGTNIADNSISSAKLISNSVASSHLQSNSVTTAKIADSAITNAKLRNSVGVSVMGRSANSSGVVADIVASANGQVLMRDSDALVFAPIGTSTVGDGSITTAKLANNAVTYGKLQQSTNPGVIGKTSPGLGNIGLITPSTADRVFLYNGTSLGFLQVPTGAIANTAVTAAKLASNAVTTDKIQDGQVTRAKLAVGAISYAGRVTNGTTPTYTIPSGWSLSRLQAGGYGITHNLGTTSYAVVITANTSGVDSYVSNVTSNTFRVYTAVSGTLTDSTFSFLVQTI